MAALSNSNGGPAGAIAYFLATNFSVPQGLGYGIAGLKYAKLNHSSGFYGYSELINDSEFQSNNKSSEEKSKHVISMIDSIFNENQIPKNLKSFGLKINDFDKLFKFCTETAKASLLSNPVVFDNEVIEKMLKEIIE